MKFKEYWKSKFGEQIKDEAQDSSKYRVLAEETSDAEKKKVLNGIADDEARHKELLEDLRTEKSDKLSEDEMTEARGLIALYNKQNKPAFEAIEALQKHFSKLASKPDAARVYWTECKRNDTRAVAELGDELGFQQYKMILSPSACEKCRKITNNGNKIFSNKEVEKSGFGHAPPFHPNCYCFMTPWVD